MILLLALFVFGLFLFESFIADGESSVDSVRLLPEEVDDACNLVSLELVRFLSIMEDPSDT